MPVINYTPRRAGTIVPELLDPFIKSTTSRRAKAEDCKTTRDWRRYGVRLPRFCIPARSQMMPVLPIDSSVGSTLNSADTRKQLLSCGSYSYQMISEAIRPALGIFQDHRPCVMPTVKTYIAEKTCWSCPHKVGGKLLEQLTFTRERMVFLRKKLVLRSRARVFIGGLRVARFPFENCTPLWKLPLPPPSFMNLREKYLEEQCPLMPFLPKRIPNWLEELKVMTNHFGVRVIELKSHNSKLSPTNPFFRNLFQWIASVTWRSSGTGRTQP